MEFRDYYQILDVAKTATAEEIKKAYRKQARKYHPDVSKEPDAETRMKEVNEANAVLSDPEKRAAYDQAGSRYRPGEEFQPPPDWGTGFEFSGDGTHGAYGDSAEFSDFFSSLFGQAGGGRGAGEHRARGGDHHAKVMIELADAYHGAIQTITLRGARLDPAGHVVTEERTLKVQIPKGVREGQHIRLAGQGSPGFGGGAAGDLYLEVHFRPDPRYRVEGRTSISLSGDPVGSHIGRDDRSAHAGGFGTSEHSTWFATRSQAAPERARHSGQAARRSLSGAGSRAAARHYGQGATTLRNHGAGNGFQSAPRHGSVSDDAR